MERSRKVPLFFLSHWFIVVFSGRQRRRGRGDGAPFPPFVLRAVRASGALTSPGLVSLFSWPRCRDVRSLLSPPCPTRGQLRIHLSPERSGLLQHAPQAGSWMARSEPGNQRSPSPRARLQPRLLPVPRACFQGSSGLPAIFPRTAPAHRLQGGCGPASPPNSFLLKALVSQP